MTRLLKNPQKTIIQITKWLSDVDWRILILLTFPPLSILVYISLSSLATTTTTFYSFAPFSSIFYNHAPRHNHHHHPNTFVMTSVQGFLNSMNESERNRWVKEKKEELNRSRIAVCLVGGARRFELTGSSIVYKILNVYPNSDLFLHSPLDSNAYKFSLLKSAPKIASVKIFKPNHIPVTDSHLRVLTADNSPNGVQGLLQYFNLVKGCLTMIKEYQQHNNFTYDWIVRTRVDSYWTAPLGPENFIPGRYLVPPGSSYGGLNDRLGIGNFNTSIVALSRLSLIPDLDLAGFRHLNSERAFKAQLTTHNIPCAVQRLPFCVLTDRKYSFPPAMYGVPVAALSSPGPLSGAKCRPCQPACSGPCVRDVMNGLDRGWSWTDWADGSLKLCDAHGEWENGWENIYDNNAGKKLAEARKRVWSMEMEQCVSDLEEMRGRTDSWEVPPVEEVCRLGGLVS